MIHELKCWPAYFQAVWDDKKTFEVRKNDRDYQVDDKRVLREWNPKTEEYTGSGLVVKVTYVFYDPQFLKDGYVILGIKKICREVNP